VTEHGLGHVRLPRAVLNDEHISNDAKIAYCALLDCNFDGRSQIGLPRLAERIGVSRSTAWRCIRELELAGHVLNCNPRKGAAASYELLSSLRGDTSPGGRSANPEISGTEKFQKRHREVSKTAPRSFTGDTHPMGTLNSFPRGDRTSTNDGAAELDLAIAAIQRRAQVKRPTVN
jgi:biotin operon repressor